MSGVGAQLDLPPAPAVAQCSQQRRTGGGGRWPLAAGGRAALASRGAGGDRCKLTPAELVAALGAGPTVSGWDEDQCWTRALIAEVVRRRFRAEYTLAGMDLLLHRIGTHPGPLRGHPHPDAGTMISQSVRLILAGSRGRRCACAASARASRTVAGGHVMTTRRSQPSRRDHQRARPKSATTEVQTETN
jgi:hypothetical protein